MESNWVKVYSSNHLHEIELIKGMLAEEDIHSFSVNKIDSTYTTFGEIELFVNADDALRAINLIKQSKGE
ncbi:MAG: putative signal transducing protein [Bacteroidia bacterium]